MSTESIPVEKKETTTNDIDMKELAKQLAQYMSKSTVNQEPQNERKIQSNEKIWFDCRGERIWTFAGHMSCMKSFESHIKNSNGKELTMELDENKQDIHNLISYVSGKRFTDNEKLGDLLFGFEHYGCLDLAKKLLEEKSSYNQGSIPVHIQVILNKLGKNKPPTPPETPRYQERYDKYSRPYSTQGYQNNYKSNYY